MLDAIEKAPIGVLRVLDDYCKMLQAGVPLAPFLNLAQLTHSLSPSLPPPPPPQVTSDVVFVEKVASLHAGSAVFSYDPKRGRGGVATGAGAPPAKGGKAGGAPSTDTLFGIRHYAGQVM